MNIRPVFFSPRTYYIDDKSFFSCAICILFNWPLYLKFFVDFPMTAHISIVSIRRQHIYIIIVSRLVSEKNNIIDNNYTITRTTNKNVKYYCTFDVERLLKMSVWSEEVLRKISISIYLHSINWLLERYDFFFSNYNKFLIPWNAMFRSYNQRQKSCLSYHELFVCDRKKRKYV